MALPQPEPTKNCPKCSELMGMLMHAGVLVMEGARLVNILERALEMACAEASDGDADVADVLKVRLLDKARREANKDSKDVGSN